MAAYDVVLTVAVEQVGLSRLRVTDAVSGAELGVFDFPDEIRMHVAPAPWWLRLRAWARSRIVRARLAWGASHRR